MAFTLDQLECLVAVAEERHFGRAAERLRMTQPPLSRQIQKLESSVGARLFDRGTRGVTATPAGAALVEEARRILAMTRAAPAMARRAADGSAGRLAVGFTATTALGLLGTLLREADELLAGVEVTLDELVTGDQLPRLRDGTLDLGLLRGHDALTDFEYRLVHRERLVVALHADHRLAGTGAPLQVGELRGCSMILYSPSTARYFADLIAAVLVNTPVRGVQRITQVHSMLALVAAGRGAALVPESATTLHPDRVVFRELVGHRDAIVELHAAWPRHTSNPALHRALAVLPALRPLAPS